MRLRGGSEGGGNSGDGDDDDDDDGDGGGGGGAGNRRWGRVRRRVFVPADPRSWGEERKGMAVAGQPVYPGLGNQSNELALLRLHVPRRGVYCHSLHPSPLPRLSRRS